MTRVFISGPLGAPEHWTENKRLACEAASRVMDAGFNPFVPHLSVAWLEVVSRRWTYERWMAWCLDYLKVCDELIRIPGDSPGADREVSFAWSNEIPVFFGVDEWFRNNGRDPF